MTASLLVTAKRRCPSFPRKRDSVGLPLVKLLPHARIDVVFLGLPGWWEREVGFTLGWWEAIVVVEVPLSALRLSVGHEDVVPGPNPPGTSPPSTVAYPRDR